MSQHGLSVYLNDHLAGASAGVALLEELAGVPTVGAAIKPIHDEVVEDKRELERIIAALGLHESTLRQAAGWAYEKLAEVKTRVDDLSTAGALHEFELLEGIAMGVDGKRALWQALRAAASAVPALQDVDFARLIARADNQRARLETLRLDAAVRALVR